MGTCGRPRCGCGRSTPPASGGDVSGWKTRPSGTFAVASAAASTPPCAPASAPSGQAARSRHGPSGSTTGSPAVRRGPSGRGRTMTAERLPNTTNPTAEPPTDPRPAWERIAYTWLAREVDGGHQVDPATLAAEVSV